MNVFHPAVPIALLMLALATVSHSAQAERGGNSQRADDFNTRSRMVETRGNGRSFSQSADSGSRTEVRERSESNRRSTESYRRVDDRVFSNRDNGSDRDNRHESRPRSLNSQELLNQRFYNDRSDNSGYYRRDNPRPVNDVIREVQHRYGGQVIGVQNSEGGSMYRVRVLQHDGRVKTVLVPAE